MTETEVLSKERDFNSGAPARSEISWHLGSVDIWSEKAQISVLFSQNAE